MIAGQLSDFELAALLPEERRDAVISRFGARGARTLARTWPCRARPAQSVPEGEWACWLILAGRGFGKTRMGAEWVRMIAATQPGARIALVAASPGDARDVMVEGESGLLAVARSRDRPVWQPSRRRLVWPNGSQASLFGASDPGSLRGPQHSYGWADEIGKWPNGEAAWDNLIMGLRLGERPQLVATTTPAPTALIQRLAADPAVVKTRGKTTDNRGALPAAFLAEMQRIYGGSTLGRQELDGELLLDRDDALWTRALIEACRSGAGVPHPAMLARVVVGVDPPAGESGDACGIVVAGLGHDGTGHIIEDATIEGASPERWARRVALAVQTWDAERVVAEANNGGAMVGSVLRAVAPRLPLRLVHASRGKSARAEPVAALYETGRVSHHGRFDALEDQLCGLSRSRGYRGPGRSPDRADALVWAVTELMLGEQGAPRMRKL